MAGAAAARELTLESAFKNMFMGIAFLIISIALSRTIGAGWWFWMLIPAFSLMGTGIAQYIRIKDREKRDDDCAAASAAADVAAGDGGVAAQNGELRPPVPSVTEGTTRHLGVEAPTRHLETHEPK